MASIDLRALQDDLAFVDMVTAPPKNLGFEALEVLLKKHEQIKIKMYQEVGHAMPHFHVDYGPQSHSASFSIETGERIEGDLPHKYEKAIASWASKNRTHLMAAWHDLQAGSTGTVFIQALSALRS